MRRTFRRPGATAATALLASTIVVTAAVPALGAGPQPSVAAAAKRHDTLAMRTLLDAGADANAPEPDGATALLWASQWNDLDAADLLIRHKARVGAANDFGVTPLRLAALNGSAPMVAKLLAAGADPNTALPSGETVLMTASMSGNVEAVRALIDAGANVNARESLKGQTALMWATSEDHADAVRLLVERGAVIRARSTAGFTPLLFAARQGNLELARLFLDRGADINGAADDGTSPLLEALVRGHVDLALFLLHHGADARAGAAGYTALHWVAGTWENATSIVFGAGDPEWRAMGGVPRSRKIELLKALLAHGADLNARIAKAPPLGRLGPTSNGGMTIIGGGPLVGATPYFLAALAADVDVMRFLASQGADPTVAAADHTTPLMAAAGATGFYDLETDLSEADHLAAVRLAHEMGADVGAVNGVGNTALHIATHGGFDTVVKFLADTGAAINVRNKNGETPLRIADGVIVIMMLYTHPSTATLLRELGGTY